MQNFLSTGSITVNLLFHPKTSIDKFNNTKLSFIAKIIRGPINIPNKVTKVAVTIDKSIDCDKNILYIKGAIPGKKNSIVEIFN